MNKLPLTKKSNTSQMGFDFQIFDSKYFNLGSVGRFKLNMHRFYMDIWLKKKAQKKDNLHFLNFPKFSLRPIFYHQIFNF